MDGTSLPVSLMSEPPMKLPKPTPNVGVLASFLFGGLYILHIFLPSGTNLAVKELYKMIPYVVTIIVLIITSVRSKRENQPPASLGLPYFREER